jgi:hypothetical protein
MGHFQVVYHKTSCFTRCRSKQTATFPFDREAGTMSVFPVSDSSIRGAAPRNAVEELSCSQLLNCFQQQDDADFASPNLKTDRSLQKGWA